MADHAPPASAARPVRALPPRQLAVPWIAVALLAVAAWAVTVVLARAMGNGPGTMGLVLLPFLGLWVVMMAAMMLPSVAPVAVLWTRLIGGGTAGPVRAARMVMFLSGYLLAWAAIGMAAFAALAGAGRLLTASPTAARWLGVAIFIVAGIYQLTPGKDWCLRRCRSPVGALMYYIGFKGRSRGVRAGLHHGTTCAGCCWGLMILLVAVGVMNVAVMAALAVVIFAEKLWRYGKPFARAVGVLLGGHRHPGHLVPLAAPRPARLRDAADVGRADHWHTEVAAISSPPAGSGTPRTQVPARHARLKRRSRESTRIF